MDTSSAETGSSQTMNLGAGDADALALAAGELMRVAHGVLGVEADELHQLHDALAALLLVFAQLVHVERFADDVFDRHARVERGVRILEDHLHLLAVGQHVDLDLLAQDGLAVGVDLEAAVFVILLAAVIDDLAVKDDAAAGGLVQLQQRAADRGLAAAGFADKAEGLARADAEGDVIDRLERDRAAKTGAHGEIFFQVLNLNEVFVVGHLTYPPWLS